MNEKSKLAALGAICPILKASAWRLGAKVAGSNPVAPTKICRHCEERSLRRSVAWRRGDTIPTQEEIASPYGLAMTVYLFSVKIHTELRYGKEN